MKEIEIATLNSDRLELIKPIIATIQQLPEENNSYFVSVGKELHYAWGLDITKEKAIEDFCKDIEETYFILKGEKLAKGIQRVWDYIQTIIKEK